MVVDGPECCRQLLTPDQPTGKQLRTIEPDEIGQQAPQVVFDTSIPTARSTPEWQPRGALG
jgi:hypothetical protein